MLNHISHIAVIATLISAVRAFNQLCNTLLAIESTVTEINQMVVQPTNEILCNTKSLVGPIHDVLSQATTTAEKVQELVEPTEEFLNASKEAINNIDEAVEIIALTGLRRTLTKSGQFFKKLLCIKNDKHIYIEKQKVKVDGHLSGKLNKLD